MHDRPRAIWSWAVRHPDISTLGYSAAGLFLGLGFSIFVTLLTGGLHSDQVSRLVWALVAGTVLAGGIALVSLTVQMGHKRMLEHNGTAYIIRERGRGWRDDEPDDFYAQVQQRFARVLDVPGPGPDWGWPLDERVRDWDPHVNELVRSLQVLQRALVLDGEVGIFVTAWWPVAFAFGMRATAADRGLDPWVWHRPSNGASGRVDADVWSQRPYRALAPVTGAIPDTVEYTWDVSVTSLPTAGNVGTRPVSVLLIQFGQPGQWGPIRPGATPDGSTLDLAVHDLAGVIPCDSSFTTRVHELRCVPPGDARQFDWDQFPALTSAAVAWIQEKARELAGHTLLLGTRIPNEVALAAGLNAGRESCTPWPEHMWPVVYRPAGDALVVARLELGVTARKE